MDPEVLIENGEVIGYALVGAIALIGLVIVQLVRRSGDVKRARAATHLASLSLSDPRPGPIAVTGALHETPTERWLDCGGQRIVLEGELNVVTGTRARWRNGTRTYTVRERDTIIAIGRMSKSEAGGWRLIRSAGEDGEAGILVYATKPRPAPRPLFPWRAPLYFVICGGLGFGALYGIGTVLVDVPRSLDAKPCSEDARFRFELATAIPVVREQALIELAHCDKTSP